MTKNRVSLTSYIVGFVGSVALTVGAYQAVVSQAFDARTTILVIVVCALAQLLLQLVCFLHVGKKSEPGWNLPVLLFTVTIIVILVGGSLWIMYNLASRMMPPPADMEAYMLNQ